MDLKTERQEAGITALFVRRPVLAFVFNTLIVVAGLAALFGVEIPRIARRRPARHSPSGPISTAPPPRRSTAR